MAVEYKPSNTKAELLAIAAANGVAVGDSMTKPQIVAALEAHNDAGRKAEAATIAADSVPTGGAEVAGEMSHTAAENAVESGAEGATVAEAATIAADGVPTGGTEVAEGNNHTPAENAAKSGAEGVTAYERATTPADGGQPMPGAQGGTENISEYTMFIYAGPSLPNGRLKENAVFRGTIEDVKNYLADALEDYPQAEKLIVPTHKIAEFSVKVKTPGNIAHKYYNDIVSTMRNKKEV